MAEPEYIRQHDDFDSLGADERWAWFQSVHAEAKAEGMTFARHTVDDARHPTRALVECWREQPEDQGPIRWRTANG